MAAGGAAGPVAAGLAVAAYAAAFRRYGVFDLADEGTLLMQALRTASGQVPYIDFVTGYGPAYFLLQGKLVAAGGLTAVRWALVATQGASAALLYALARRVAGVALAVAAVGLYVALFLPVVPSKGAPFNVPYPSWYAGLAGLAVALLLGGARPVAHPTALIAGVLAGLAFALQPKSGGLLAAGAAMAIVLARPAPVRAGLLGRLVLAAGFLAAGGLVASGGVGAVFWVLVPPVAVLGALGLVRGAPDAEAAPRLALLAAGFLGTAGGLLASPLVVLGPAGFVREVLLVGAGVAELYARPLPWPAALAAAVGALGCIAPSARAVPLLVLAAAVLAIPLATAAPTAASIGAALRSGAEEAALVAVPLACWGALRRLRAPDAGTLAAPTAVGVTAALQLYPRPDLRHLMPLAPLLLPLALGAARAAVPLLPVPARAARAAAVTAVLGLVLVRLAPTAGVAADLALGRSVEVAVGGTRLAIASVGAEALQALAVAADAVRDGTGPRDTVITFPACAIVPFFAGRLPAGPHDCFFPGRPTRARAAVLAVTLGAERPPLAVTCHPVGSEFAAAWEYYPEMVGLIAARYRPRLTRPPFVVHEAIGRAMAARDATNERRERSVCNRGSGSRSFFPAARCASAGGLLRSPHVWPGALNRAEQGRRDPDLQRARERARAPAGGPGAGPRDQGDRGR